MLQSLLSDHTGDVIIQSRMNEQKGSLSIGQLHFLEKPVELTLWSKKQFLPFQHGRINLPRRQIRLGTILLEISDLFPQAFHFPLDRHIRHYPARITRELIEPAFGRIQYFLARLITGQSG